MPSAWGPRHWLGCATRPQAFQESRTGCRPSRRASQGGRHTPGPAPPRAGWRCHTGRGASDCTCQGVGEQNTDPSVRNPPGTLARPRRRRRAEHSCTVGASKDRPSDSDRGHTARWHGHTAPGAWSTSKEDGVLGTARSPGGPPDSPRATPRHGDWSEPGASASQPTPPANNSQWSSRVCAGKGAGRRKKVRAHLCQAQSLALRPVWTEGGCVPSAPPQVEAFRHKALSS